MECYFGTYKRDNRGPGGKKTLVCFSIPAKGISFKAPFDGAEPLHTEYASLLTLLEFIELNGKYFKGKEIRIFGHNPDMIKQVNENFTPRFEFSELLRKTIDYKKKLNFSLGWVSPEDNPSINYLYD
jgi:hypothetical protein